MELFQEINGSASFFVVFELIDILDVGVLKATKSNETATLCRFQRCTGCTCHFSVARHAPSSNVETHTVCNSGGGSNSWTGRASLARIRRCGRTSTKHPSRSLTVCTIPDTAGLGSYPARMYFAGVYLCFNKDNDVGRGGRWN